MMINRIVLSFLLALSMFVFVNAQEADKKIIQFSGYVLTPDTLMGIPFVTIQVNNSSRGTITNQEGFFSFAAGEGDTIHFSSIGFEESFYYIPTNLQTNKYSIVKLLSADTYYIDTVT
ncbi:MAG: hypothetical protein ACI8V8_001617, partial [Chitinophagales bacterium]